MTPDSPKTVNEDYSWKPAQLKMEISYINTMNIQHKGLVLSVSLGENSNMYVTLSYLSPVMVDISITWVNFCSHVEILRGVLGLLLLHVHASPFNECISTQLKHITKMH